MIHASMISGRTVTKASATPTSRWAGSSSRPAAVRQCSKARRAVTVCCQPENGAQPSTVETEAATNGNGAQVSIFVCAPHRVLWKRLAHECMSDACRHGTAEVHVHALGISSSGCTAKASASHVHAMSRASSRCRAMWCMSPAPQVALSIPVLAPVQLPPL